MSELPTVQEISEFLLEVQFGVERLISASATSHDHEIRKSIVATRLENLPKK